MEEFVQGRRDIQFSICEEEDDGSKNYHLLGGPSSSSSTPCASSSSAPAMEREHMFDKVLTPSDVGKLNRLVLPKQYAEKYFPLDAAANEKGLLLNFDDRSGKPWRFRYSYWNSSQSYVMTKGWSRFVKEKRLDAGDIVSFARGVTARDSLFIDCKRRPEALLLSHHHHHPLQPRRFSSVPSTGPYPLMSFNRSSAPPLQLLPSPAVYYGCNSIGGGGGQFMYLPSAAAVRPGPPDGNAVLDSVPVVGHRHGQAAAKRVRLFGVNLECPESDGGGVPQRAAQPQTRPALPHLQLRLGGADDSPEHHSPLELDL